jgi:hypothetical protein
MLFGAALSIFCRRFEESAASFPYIKAGSSKKLAPVHQIALYHISVDSHVMLLSARINLIGLPTFFFSKYIELFVSKEQNR